MPRNLFLVIAPVALCKSPESGSAGVRWLANGQDRYFWSFDSSESTPLSRRHEAAKYIQEIQGFDPLTQDYTRARGLPLVEMLSSLGHFHPNAVDPTEEDQEALDAWYDAEETLSYISESESVYGDASS
ncbi:hypothetical protein K435DRAFT_869580 [Dendrothele bispora CBS 962.96]|uniref:Uncharacterized protein n=1 Tax=Dendrothele bispora (strain CBS 962.96) TaxID=1314807 RepID=A0A4V4HCY5_DENBC|nr:hypothetical protein K435DRAFT_869580 [Dendrothele bispora CBS 962.96]